ncbi:MAG: VOC family protein [Nitrospira sp.]|nr:VOC family protein [Nitrospira sp.]
MSEQVRQDIPTGKGLRHVALNVTDLEVSKTFYQTWFGMTTVWEPDAENVYMSSGVDNLALHQIPKENMPAFQRSQGQFLDHLGFVMDSPESVAQLYQRVVNAGVEIIHHPKQHRDGSYSFYLADPDRIVIQILYEPTISPIRFSTET